MRPLSPYLGPIWRALRVAEHLLTGVAIGVGVCLMRRVGLPCNWLPVVVQWWHRRLCRCLALRIATEGCHYPPALLIANHISWLDIPSLGGLAPISFLSKGEVRDWPVIGWMSALAGTLFLERGAHQAASASTQIAALIRSGHSVALFPEGTTSDGSELLRFHPRLFTAAQLEPAANLQPVAIRYGTREKPDAIAPFIGDDTLLAHLLRVLRHPGMKVQISFLSPIDCASRDRRALAKAAQDAIKASLDRDYSSADASARVIETREVA